MSFLTRRFLPLVACFHFKTCKNKIVISEDNKINYYFAFNRMHNSDHDFFTIKNLDYTCIIPNGFGIFEAKMVTVVAQNHVTITV